jgi:hypothetical protein
MSLAQIANVGAAMDFLLAQGFSIDTMCNTGIRYLSRAEEQSALRTAADRCRTRPPPSDMQVQQYDQECLEFLQSARLAINTWLAEGVVRTPANEAPKAY